jgi:hypothetical protein
MKTISKFNPLFLWAFLAAANPLVAQWFQTDGSYGGNVTSLVVSGGYLIAGTDGSGIWRHPLSGLTTSAALQLADLPNYFALKQNYPNPFNPTTNISFTLPSRSLVSLKVFDILGREVAILASEELPSGTHTHQWNAAGLPSGFYFYRIQSGGFVETKKLVLLR